MPAGYSYSVELLMLWEHLSPQNRQYVRDYINTLLQQQERERQERAKQWDDQRARSRT